MAIQSISEITNRASVPPMPAVAPSTAAAGPDGRTTDQAGGAPQGPVHAAPPPPPPPPLPRMGVDLDVVVGMHEETKTKTYTFVEPQSGDEVVQIPVQGVLDLVAAILRQMEAEGKR